MLIFIFAIGLELFDHIITFVLKNVIKIRKKGEGFGYKLFCTGPRLPRLLSNGADVLVFGTDTDIIENLKK